MKSVAALGIVTRSLTWLGRACVVPRSRLPEGIRPLGIEVPAFIASLAYHRAEHRGVVRRAAAVPVELIGDVHIDVGLRRHGQRDCGRGIPETIVAFMTEPFFTHDSSCAAHHAARGDWDRR